MRCPTFPHMAILTVLLLSFLMASLLYLAPRQKFRFDGLFLLI